MAAPRGHEGHRSKAPPARAEAPAGGGADQEATAKAETQRAATAYARANIIGASVGIALGIAISVAGITYGLVARGMPGPGLFPLVLGVALTVLSVIWLVDPRQRELTTADEDFAVADTRARRLIAVTLIASVGFVLLLNPIGYQLAMLVFVGVLLKLVSQRGWISTVVISVAFAFGSYMLFVLVLGVPLPTAAIPLLASIGL